MRMKRFFGTVAAAAIAVGAFVPVAQAKPLTHSCNQGKNIVDTAVAAGSFKTLVSLVGKAGLADTLANQGPFTVFAPTDDAFAKVPADALAALGGDTAKLKSVLLYHVVSGKISSHDAAAAGSAKTLNGADVTFTKADHGLRVNDANVVAADVQASNGVIHAIDSVLMPPAETPAPAPKNIVDTAVAAGSFKTLVSLVGKAGLADTLANQGPFTVFAPTDDAFAKVPADALAALGADTAKLKAVLLYHVVAGKVLAADAAKLTSATTLNGADVKITASEHGLKVNDANVVTADVIASNGVIHAIDGVLTPPEPLKNIVDTAVAAGSFKTLVSLVGKAGLADTLANQGPFTVFAPTDDAFAKVPADALAALGADTAKLKAVLLYHVVAGKVLAADAVKAGTAKTLNGASVAIRKISCHRGKWHYRTVRRHGKLLRVRVKRTCGAIKVNDAKVVAADVLASNGVIHVIDGVLLPPAA